jgi:hypothetical protein
MKCFEKDCTFTGNPTEAKSHTELTGHETGSDYIRFKPDHPTKAVPVGTPVTGAAEAKPTEGAKA